ncbi:MAG: hypothetical protein R2692_02830 [Microbacterium sp.]
MPDGRRVRLTDHGAALAAHAARRSTDERIGELEAAAEEHRAGAGRRAADGRPHDHCPQR